MAMTKQMYQTERFLYNNDAIDWIRTLNYLGFLISYNGKSQSLVEDRVFRAPKVPNMGIQAIRTNKPVWNESGLNFIRQTDLAYTVLW